LIGVAPSGLITFCSHAYGGRASDKAIFLQSGLIEKFIPYKDAVMSDRWFLVEHELTMQGIKLIRPPFLGRSKQFSVGDGLLTAGIARARIHVERSIQTLKIFKIVKGQLPWSLVSRIDDIMTTVAGIVNLSKPILGKDKF
jgi:DDE superfamily endonuclease